MILFIMLTLSYTVFRQYFPFCKYSEANRKKAQKTDKKYYSVNVIVMFDSAIWYLVKVILKKMHAADLPIENNLLQICKNVSILIARCFEFEFFMHIQGSME